MSQRGPVRQQGLTWLCGLQGLHTSGVPHTRGSEGGNGDRRPLVLTWPRFGCLKCPSGARHSSLPLLPRIPLALSPRWAVSSGGPVLGVLETLRPHRAGASSLRMEGQPSVLEARPNEARELVKGPLGKVRDVGRPGATWVPEGAACLAAAMSSAVRPEEGPHAPPWRCGPPRETAGPACWVPR